MKSDSFGLLRTPLVALILIVIPNLVYAELDENCTEPLSASVKESLIGPIKTFETGIVEFKEEPSGKVKEQARIRNYIVHYDRNGNMSDETIFSGGKGRKNVYTYDQNGVLLTEHSYDANGRLTSNQVYEYDKERRNLTSSNYILGKLSGRTVYKFDENWRVIEKNHYYTDGRLYVSYVYRFDTHGNLLEKKESRQSGRHKENLLCTYDTEDRILSSVDTTTQNSKTLVANETLYEHSGNKVIVTTVNHEPFSRRFKSGVLSYGPDEEIKISDYKPNGTIWVTIVRNAKDGRVMRQDSEDTLLGYHGLVNTYEFDALGNWTKKFVFCGKPYADKSSMKLCYVMYRKITYYDDLDKRETLKSKGLGSQMYLLMGRGSLHRPIPLPFLPPANL